MLDKTKRGWWKSAVLYQIYPKSFQDTNGDGIGDLKGVISRLDYLEKLGIDGIWLSPVFKSPQYDNGYDISDYRDIDPMFGSVADMEELIAEAKKRGISIILDLVLNHSSSFHPWFLEAKKGKDNPYHDYYVWRDGEEGTPPNDMRAVFGGSAWEYVPEIGQYYFHQFVPEQPDLNWENPKVRQELYDMIRFWIGKGAGGFRLDVIDQVAKEPDNFITASGPKLHEFLQELSREAFIDEGLVTVGEAWSANVERAKRFSAPDGSEMSMVFQFEHICLAFEGEKWNPVKLNLLSLKDCMERWQQGLCGCGWNSLFLENHDLPRIVSVWGDEGEYREASAKMLAIFLHGMQGTPYIYQGQELGMTNVRWPIENYDDIEIRNFYAERTAQGVSAETVLGAIHARGRDNARTPMQWTAEENAGFTSGKPWLPVNENHAFINVEAALADENSIFYTYQKLISLRKTLPVIAEGSFELVDRENAQVFAYRRDHQGTKLLVVCNFEKQDVPFVIPEEFEGSELLMGNYGKLIPSMLRPFEAFMLLKREKE